MDIRNRGGDAYILIKQSSPAALSVRAGGERAFRVSFYDRPQVARQLYGPRKLNKGLAGPPSAPAPSAGFIVRTRRTAPLCSKAQIDGRTSRTSERCTNVRLCYNSDQSVMRGALLIRAVEFYWGYKEVQT
ncbi:hypothetical protein EVAR_88347_1 [Eumeta japonica]|uniref:Uncharacterized protein n=1 Tax=Eumeta variegata TaxID=151549 RepID=A0A4C1Y816_EUMVA|nr:hypothetical protein EVAR_88347_1 [Eumeta japonica]